MEIRAWLRFNQSLRGITGYDELSAPLKLKGNALLALAEFEGIDTDSIKEQVLSPTQN